MDRGYDFKTGKLVLKCEFVNFDLLLRAPITQITGNSGTGKSLLADTITLLKKDIVLNNTEDYLRNIVTFGADVTFNDIKDLSDVLVILDNGDISLMDDSIVDFICTDRRNHYLIFARCGYNIGISPNYVGDFVVDNGTVTVKYKFNETSWF